MHRLRIGVFRLAFLFLQNINPALVASKKTSLYTDVSDTVYETGLSAPSPLR